MAKTTKPTKQQIAQAKARAGGNNPVKVTNAGLKKLGNAALMAASFTPVGRVAKVAATAAKAAKAEVVMAKAGWNKAAKESYRASVKRGTYAEPKSGVKIKPAAKQKPNKPDVAKTMFKNDSSRTRASDRAIKEYEKNVKRHGERPADPSFGSKMAERVAMNTQLKRKPNLQIKKKSK